MNEKTRCGGRWTEGRYRGFITSTLRGGFRRWAVKYDVLKAAFAGRKVNKKSGRKANHYVCGICGKHFVQSGIQIDHITPIGHCDSWNEFVEKLYCEQDNLQVACKSCHKKKSKKEQSANRL